jgi:hypothetical protein
MPGVESIPHKRNEKPQHKDENGIHSRRIPFIVRVFGDLFLCASVLDTALREPFAKGCSEVIPASGWFLESERRKRRKGKWVKTKHPSPGEIDAWGV